jgi:hypothetical protein
MGATGIACADAMPRPTAKAIEAKSFMLLPPRAWKAEFHRNAAEYAMKDPVEFSPQCSLRGSAFSETRLDRNVLLAAGSDRHPSCRDNKRKPSRIASAGVDDM